MCTELVDRIGNFNVVIIDGQVEPLEERRRDDRADRKGVGRLFLEIRIAARLYAEAHVDLIEGGDLGLENALFNAKRLLSRGRRQVYVARVVSGREADGDRVEKLVEIR